MYLYLTACVAWGKVPFCGVGNKRADWFSEMLEQLIKLKAWRAFSQGLWEESKNRLNTVESAFLMFNSNWNLGPQCLFHLTYVKEVQIFCTWQLSCPWLISKWSLSLSLSLRSLQILHSRQELRQAVLLCLCFPLKAAVIAAGGGESGLSLAQQQPPHACGSACASAHTRAHARGRALYTVEGKLIRRKF